MFGKKKVKWASSKDEQTRPPTLSAKLALSGRLLRIWDIILDWFNTPIGRIVLATIALSAAWFLLKA